MSMEIVRRTIVLWIVALLPALAGEALQRGDFDLAIHCLDTYLCYHPDNPAAHVQLGYALFKKGDFDRSIESYNEALRLDPKCAAAYLGRGSTQGAAGRLDRAIADLTRALELDPDSTDAYRARAVCFENRKQYARAAADYEAVLHRDAENEVARLTLVELLATCPDDRVRNVARADKQARHLNPRAASSHRVFARLAAAHARAGELERAIYWQRKVVAFADPLDKEEKKRAQLVLNLYRKRKKKDDTASASRAPRRASSGSGGGK
jgi:tetratricopeptide (TPR) repeat protein